MFTKIFTDENKRREIWPVLIEKAYAKFFGGYDEIGDGGYVDSAMADLCGGIASWFRVNDAKGKQMLETGAATSFFPGFVAQKAGVATQMDVAT